MDLNSARTAYRSLCRKSKGGALSSGSSAILAQCASQFGEGCTPATEEKSLHDVIHGMQESLCCTDAVFEWEMVAFWLLLVRESNAIAIDVIRQHSFFPLFLQLLSHEEPRVRELCVKLIPAIHAASVGSEIKVNDELGDALLTLIKSKFVRAVDSQPSRLGSEGSIPLDDTTGWSSLESSVVAYHELVRCSSVANLLRILRDQDTCVLLIKDASVHQNRFIREATILFIASICEMLTVASAVQSVFATGVIEDRVVSVKFPVLIVDALQFGLDDNWSRIRQASCTATAAFFSALPETEKVEYWPKLLPGVCLNRFYAADGVKTVALEAWKGLVGTRGRSLVSSFIGSFVHSYAEASQSNNHMVSEASCSAMAELLCRIETDAVLPHLNHLVQALEACIADNSWPVRDASCVATGSLIKHYSPAVVAISANITEKFLAVCRRHLQDSIWSLRENAAIALGDALQCESTAVREQVDVVVSSCLDENLNKALSATSGVITRSFLTPAQLSMLTDSKVSSSSGGKSSAVWRKGGGLGCCLDCMETREGDSFDVSSGGVFLLREVAKCHPAIAARHLEKVWLLLNLRQPSSSNSKRGTPSRDRLLITILEQLPEIFKLLVKGDHSEKSIESWNSNKSRIEVLLASDGETCAVRDAARDSLNSLKSIL